MLDYFKFTPKLLKKFQKLTLNEMRVLLVLFLNQNVRTSISHPMRIQRISELSGIKNLTHVYNAIRGLKKKRAICNCKNHKQGTHKYVLLWYQKEK